MCLVLVLAACGESVRGNDESGPAGKAGMAADGGATSRAGTGSAGQAPASGGTAAAGRAGMGSGGTTPGAAGARAGSNPGGGGSGGSAGRDEHRAGRGGLAGMAGLPAAGASQGGAGAGGAGGQPQGGMAGTAAGSGGAGGDGRCRTADPPQSCAVTPASYMATVIDFERYANDGTWTSAEAGGITGKTSLYHDAGGADLTLAVVGNELRVSGTIPGGLKHAGWVFEFDSCVDGENNLGFALMLGGNLSGMRVTVAVETNEDYPADASSGKGACTFVNCDTHKPDCAFPYTFLEPTLSTFTYKQWSDFTVGAPESTVTAMSAIRGLRFDVECEQDIADCTVSLTLGIVKFFQA